MSISNNIKLLLDIQDENIYFEENAVVYKEFKGKTAKFITGKLTYTPTHCECCGVKNENYTIYKNGTKTSRITLPFTGIHPTYLLLKKQRFFCKACNHSFIAKSSIVEKHCFISKQSRAHVLIKSAEAQTITSIAQDCSVSPSTVQRMINEEVRPYKFTYQSLPNHLSFDEFKYGKGKMAFEYINSETGEILGILSQRTGKTIKDHFYAKYSLKQRNQVKTVTIDMNSSYVGIIKELFPQAEIIIDRFHLVQLINRSMNKTRIQVMNRFRTSKGEDMKKYRRLKRYWKLILKKQMNLSLSEYKYYRLFGQRTEAGIVDEMLDYDEKLKVNYKIYQKLLYCIKKEDFVGLEKVLYTKQDKHLSSYIKTSIKTLKKHLPYIKNTFKFPYNNGRIEGINNKIKILSRISYGYRNFVHYQNRIILHFKFRQIKETHKQKRHSEAA